MPAAQKFKHAGANAAKIMNSAEFKMAKAKRENAKAFKNSQPRESFWPEGKCTFTPIQWDLALDKHPQTGQVTGNIYSVSLKIKEPAEDIGRTFLWRMSTRLQEPSKTNKVKEAFSPGVADMRKFLRACELDSPGDDSILLTEDDECNEDLWPAFLDAICGAHMLLTARGRTQEREYKDAKGETKTSTDRRLYDLKLVGAGETEAPADEQPVDETPPEDAGESAGEDAGEDATDDAGSPAFSIGDDVTIKVSGKVAKGTIKTLDEGAETAVVLVPKLKKQFTKEFKDITAA